MCNKLEQNQIKESKKCLIEAIELCDETMPPGAGVFRGSLALMYAKDGLFSEAISLLEKGEPQVRVYVKEYAKFLCKKSEVYFLKGDLAFARDSLKQAESTVDEVTQGSVLSKMIAKMRMRLQ